MPPKRVIVTPAGRKRYLDVLAKHLVAQKHHFDEWLLLVNTSVVEDIGFCERLAARHDFIDTRYAEGSRPDEASFNIHRFLNQFCRDPDVLYLRLDDDVCYLAPDFVDTMFAFREANPAYFLVYANTINNAVLTWVHAKVGNFTEPRGTLTYNCVCDVGWKNPECAQAMHEAFLADPRAWKLPTWVATDRERISVNAVCWRGQDMEHEVEPDEEVWLSVTYPAKRDALNAVCGDAVCVHFAYHPQRQHLEECTDLLARYAALGVHEFALPDFTLGASREQRSDAMAALHDDVFRHLI